MIDLQKARELALTVAVIVLAFLYWSERSTTGAALQVAVASQRTTGQCVALYSAAGDSIAAAITRMDGQWGSR